MQLPRRALVADHVVQLYWRMVFFLKGCVLGLSIAAPVGPIGLLCIRRTLTQGRAAGFVSGLGAATADFVYACVAAFGLSAVMQPLVSTQQIFRLAGGAFLLYLAFKTFLEKPADGVEPASGGTLARCFATTLALTIANPMTVLSFVAMFTALGATTNGGTFVAAGVFTGSAIWWLTLAGVTGLIREHMDVRRLRFLNRGAGLLIGAFGIAALWQWK
jgi:threonine/homoserine/homoserine lactone efflux protein